MIADIINEYQLELYNYIWHYSFQEKLLNQDFLLKKTINDHVYLFAKPYNQWSPAPLFTNFHKEHNIRSLNIVNKKYNYVNQQKRKVFWFLKTNSFTEYLDERTIISKQPLKHFPTSKNYLDKRSKINGTMEMRNYNESFFYEHYNYLKQDKHLDAKTIFQSLVDNNPNLPRKWIKTATLSHDNNIVAIFLIIDDGKSISLNNLASERNKLSYGLILCTDLVKHCCERGYYSFDSGVSGIYGTYKDKIFLHSRELNQKKKYKLF